MWSSRQIWIDHIYFESQLTYDRKGNGLDEVGKFIWINTPYETYADKKDRFRSPDYVTISYCHLKNRYWTVAYGTQNDEYRRDRTTLLYNWWDKNVRRCPQLGNGFAHIYNNYYSAYGDAQNGNATTGIIAGDNSEMISMNNRFNGYTARQALKINFTPANKSSWAPEKTEYGYTLLSAYNTKGTDTKDFCSRYAGDQSAQSSMKYVTDKEFDCWAEIRYPSPFLRSLAVGDEPVIKKEGATFEESATYTLKNISSGFYLNGTTPFKNGSDVIQGDEFAWNFKEVGNGYYRLSTAENADYYLDLYEDNTSNGTNIGIYENTKSTAQYFKFVESKDGTFEITTANTKDKSCLGIGAASKEKGASVIQWECDGTANQKWIVAEKVVTTKIANANTASKLPIKVNLFDLKGKQLQVFWVNQPESAAKNIRSNIPQGVYYLKMESANFTKVIYIKK